MKYLLDTCVLTDLTKKDVNAGLLAWYKKQKEEDLYISVVTLSEISKGVALLTQGRKKKILIGWFEEIRDVFADQTIAIDSSMAVLAGHIEAQKKSVGLNFSLADCLLAATVQIKKLTIVTRNEKDFTKLDCDVINPWQ